MSDANRAVRARVFTITNAVTMYDVGSRLHGFNERGVTQADYASRRARALYEALGTVPSDDEYVLGTLPGGRWALVGLPVDGHRYAIEEGWGTSSLCRRSRALHRPQ